MNMSVKSMKYKDMPAHLPFRMVEYHDPSWSHTHQFEDIFEANAEDMAIGLAETVMSCSPDKHDGHGAFHTHKEAEIAFDAAMEQMDRNADETAYQTLREKIRQYEMWGGQVPKLVLYPQEDNPKEWNALLTDDKGNPTIYKAPSNLVEDLLPNPTDKTAYLKDGAWRSRRKRKPKRIT